MLYGSRVGFYFYSRLYYLKNQVAVIPTFTEGLNWENKNKKLSDYWFFFLGYFIFQKEKVTDWFINEDLKLTDIQH